jgi:peptidoglycan/xylan/chitin deacetylase (PgdA/CDA1 family)
MSTLTDHQILGELGWTSQAIYDLSGGFVPKYWRPPYVSMVLSLRTSSFRPQSASQAFANLPVEKTIALPPV